MSELPAAGRTGATDVDAVVDGVDGDALVDGVDGDALVDGVDGDALVDGVDVDAVTAAVVSCPGVFGVYASAMSEITTLLPGRRVPGVRIRADELVVEVVARWGVTARELAAQLRTALRPLAGGHRLHIVIADIAEPADSPSSISGEESRVDS